MNEVIKLILSVSVSILVSGTGSEGLSSSQSPQHECHEHILPIEMSRLCYF